MGFVDDGIGLAPYMDCWACAGGAAHENIHVVAAHEYVS